jgi:hypothetical protein
LRDIIYILRMGPVRYKLTAEAAKILGCDKNKTAEQEDQASKAPGREELQQPSDRFPWA